MMIKMLIPKFCKHIIRNWSQRYFSSALYITDDKAQKNFVLLTPVIDFEKQLENEESLYSNITARGLDINLNKLVERWNFFQSINQRKILLEHTKTEIGNQISHLFKNSEHDNNKEAIDKLKMHFKLVKDDIKNIKTFYYGVEEDTMLKVLSLPNALHKKTPHQEEKIIYTFLEKFNGISKNHMEVGADKGFLKYIDPFTCFLKGDAAFFEMSILNYFRRCLEELEYFQLTSPNFCRSVVVEGCGDKPSNLLLIEEDDSVDKLNRLHLCGGSSIFSYMAYFTRHTIQPTILPIKCFSLGKKYQLLSNTADKNLFNLNQQSVVSFFVATSEEEDYQESIVSQVIRMYEKLGYHFKLVFLPANQIDKAESFHLSIQMFSNFLGKYVEVGNISGYESYLSKRLLFSYTKNKQQLFPKIISGTLINIPMILGCVLENNSLSGDTILTDDMKKKCVYK